MGKLIVNCYPLLLLPTLACKIGLNESIVLQQIHYWIEKNREKEHNFHQGRYWTYGTYDSWQQQFPFWSVSTLRRIFKSLEVAGYLISGNFNKKKYDQTKWYTVNYELLQANDDVPIMGESVVGESPIPSVQFEQMDEFRLDIPVPDAKETNKSMVRKYGETTHIDLDTDAINPETRNEIKQFIQWYYREYAGYTGQRHPNLKLKQLRKVFNCLYTFTQEHSVDIDELKIMAVSFFKHVKSDYNINHFATYGILEIRYLSEII